MKAVARDGSDVPGKKVSVAFVILPESAFEARGIFYFEDAAPSVDEKALIAFGFGDMWPDCGQLIARAEALGFGDSHDGCERDVGGR